MRDLTKLETLSTAGGNTALTTGALFISSVAIFLFLSCYTKRYCGWQAAIIDNTYFQYQWVCN